MMIALFLMLINISARSSSKLAIRTAGAWKLLSRIPDLVVRWSWLIEYSIRFTHPRLMNLLVAGRSMKQIAGQLQISVPTCSKHRAKVLEKLDVDNDVRLALWIHGRTTAPRSE